MRLGTLQSLGNRTEQNILSPSLRCLRTGDIGEGWWCVCVILSLGGFILLIPRTTQKEGSLVAYEIWVCGSFPSTHLNLSLTILYLLLFSLQLLLLKSVRNLEIPFFFFPTGIIRILKVYWFHCSLWKNPGNKIKFFWEETSDKKGPYLFKQLKHPQPLQLFKTWILPKGTMPHQNSSCQEKGTPHNWRTGLRINKSGLYSWKLGRWLWLSQSTSLSLSLSISARGYYCFPFQEGVLKLN